MSDNRAPPEVARIHRAPAQHARSIQIGISGFNPHELEICILICILRHIYY